MAESLLAAIKRQALLTDEVIVSYSGGKDSAVVLDLCARHFKVVRAFFMFQVQGLSFQEAALCWAERQYGIEIYRIPHFELSHFYRAGVFRKSDPDAPSVTVRDIYAHVRGALGSHWIAGGERAKDSTIRNAMIKRSGSVDVKRGRFYPLAYWSKEQVARYVDTHRLKVSSESAILGHSFRSLDGGDLKKIRDHYPDDYERIAAAFPDIGAAVARQEMYA